MTEIRFRWNIIVFLECVWVCFFFCLVTFRNCLQKDARKYADDIIKLLCGFNEISVKSWILKYLIYAMLYHWALPQNDSFNSTHVPIVFCFRYLYIYMLVMNWFWCNFFIFFFFLQFKVDLYESIRFS